MNYLVKNYRLKSRMNDAKRRVQISGLKFNSVCATASLVFGAVAALCFNLFLGVAYAQEEGMPAEDPEFAEALELLRKEYGPDFQLADPVRESRIERESKQYGFNSEYAQIIDYTQLCEDRLFPTEALSNIMQIWYFEKDNTEEPLRIAKEAFKKCREKYDPWDFKAGEAYKRDPLNVDMLGNCGVTYAQCAQLYGLTLELHGDYEEALMQYGLAYASNPEALKWTYARFHYHKGLHERSFSEVCDAVQEYHNNLTPETVEDATRKINEYAEKIVKYRFLVSPRRFILSGSPIGRDKNSKMEQDIEILELYRIRDWCVRFICPNIIYVNPNAYNGDGPSRRKLIKKIREDYLTFMEFIEEEYAKWNEGEYVPGKLQFIRARSQQYDINRVEDTMALLRKMKELPY